MINVPAETDLKAALSTSVHTLTISGSRPNVFSVSKCLLIVVWLNNVQAKAAWINFASLEGDTTMLESQPTTDASAGELSETVQAVPAAIDGML